MTLAALSLRNVRRSLHSWRLWFVSVSAAATAFYLFQAARFDPVINGLVSSRLSLTTGMVVAGLILALFTGIFMAYSASFFVRGRSREIGLYRLFGIRRRRIALMLLMENGISGLAALALGLVMGVVLSKLFLMGMARILDLEISVGLAIDPQAITWTVGCFCLLILLASVSAAASVFRTRLAEVFERSRIQERGWKIDPVLGVLSLFLLAAGYVWAGFTDIRTLITNFIGVSFITTIGTWAFARGAAGLAVRLLRRNDRWFLKAPRMVALSNVAQKIGSNARVFFIIAMVSAVAMIALGVGLNMKFYIENSLNLYLPNELSLSGHLAADREQVVASLAKAGVQAQEELSIGFLKATRLLPPENHDGAPYFAKPTAYRLYQASAYLALAETRQRQAREARRQLEGLTMGQAIEFEPFPDSIENLVGKTLDFSLNERQTLSISVVVKDRLVMGAANLPMVGKILVISDADYRRLAEAWPDRVCVQTDYRLDYPRPALPILEQARDNPKNNLTVDARLFQKDVIQGFNIYLFSGVFLGIIFLCCACSILHFKQLMDAREDCVRFETLRKIGMSSRDEKRAAVLQVLPLYAIPMILAMSHGLVALLTMGRVLHIDVVLPVILNLATFAALFSLFALGTTRAYRKAIRQAGC